MKLDVVLLPVLLTPEHLKDKTVVVFDVLRATTSMTAALGVGVREIRVFGDLDSVRAAAKTCTAPHLMCGEVRAVKPEGFDLGNSPGAFKTELHKGRTLLMSTTNGTRAILAAKGAGRIFVAALVNARAAAEAVIAAGLDATLLCSGTEGRVSLEDVLGAGAVMDAVRGRGVEVELVSDSAQLANFVFLSRRGELEATLAGSRGGHNIQRAGLTADIAFCAKVDSLGVVGEVKGEPPVVSSWVRS
jgi:2-phosphosulfolactate phosphatase